MNLRTIRLVYEREWRDQMRDSRTLFTVLVLPILIYPILSLAIFQIAQFSSADPCRIWLVGSEHLPADPPLLAERGFAAELLDAAELRLTAVQASPAPTRGTPDGLRRYFAGETAELDAASLEWLRQSLSQGRFDLAILVPPELVPAASPDQADRISNIRIITNSSRGTSVVAAQRAQTAIQRWTQQLILMNLDNYDLKVADVKPFRVALTDVADRATAAAVQWSKTLPLIIVIWSLTGAFYPAVDLCAGEKERGTLETLLSSSASRADIIGGKLLTVMSFSFLTAVLNLCSLGISAGLIVGPASSTSLLGKQLGITLPPFSVIPILLLALFPISALFSALAFAVASFARSSKEGQYYLMPLLMLTFPLLFIPMLPGARLGMGTSMIPVSGLILLLHTIIEGDFGRVAAYFGPVSAVTIICCGLAIKWSVRQFDDESILFRTVNPVSLGARLRHFVARRRDFPSASHAVFCAVLILVAKFFSNFWLAAPADWNAFWRQTVGLLLLIVAFPATAFAAATCRRPWASLGFVPCRLWIVAVAGLLAVCLHPIYAALAGWVMQIYPVSGAAGQAEAMLQNLFGGAPGWWSILLVLAIVPAICEELAFRGYVLTGLRKSLGELPAILAASLLFGITHGIFQQSIVTFFVGLVLGWITVRTGSIFPCIAFHAVHNSLTMSLSQIDPVAVARSTWLQRIFSIDATGGVSYQPLALAAGAVAAAWLIFVLERNSTIRRDHSPASWSWRRVPRSAG
jgi:sodium transport system permease protein